MLLVLTLLLAYCSAQNITVEDNSTDISYSSQQFGAASICQVDANGQLIGGQAGCYNVADKCTDSLHVATQVGDSVSFTFAGTAIYFNGLSDTVTGLLNVSVDGETTQVDGFSNNGPFVCRTMFSKTGLAPGVNHTINITLIGASPQTPSNQSDGFVELMVDQFIYTADNSTSDSNTASNSTGTNSTSTGAGSGAGSGASKPNIAFFSGLVGAVLSLFVKYFL